MSKFEDELLFQFDWFDEANNEVLRDIGAKADKEIADLNDKVSMLQLENCKGSSYVDDLEAENERLRKWVSECKDEILYPLSHEETELGALAEGFGAMTVGKTL